MLDSENTCNTDCPPRDVLDLIGSKWVIMILCCLKSGPMRTGELMRAATGISQKMLTQTLRDLEHNGFVERISHPEVPPRVEYRLTDLGHSLSELTRVMEQWAVANYPAILAQRSRAAGQT